MSVLTNYRGGYRELVPHQPVLVEVVELPDVVLADQVFLSPAASPHALQGNLRPRLSKRQIRDKTRHGRATDLELNSLQITRQLLSTNVTDRTTFRVNTH